MQSKLIDVIGTVNQTGTLTGDFQSQISSNGSVSIDFSVLSKGSNPKQILGGWTEQIGKAVNTSNIPAGIDVQSSWIKNPNPNVTSNGSIVIPDSTNAWSILGANITHKAEDIYEQTFKIGQAVGSQQMSMSSTNLPINLNPMIVALTSSNITSVITITPPDDGEQLWFNKMFNFPGKMQITIAALANKFAQYGIVPDDDDTMKKIFGGWDDYKEYINAVVKAKVQGLHYWMFYTPEIDVTIRGSYDVCKNLCSNSKIGFITPDALGALDWFKDFWVPPTSGGQYKLQKSPITGQDIQFNFLVTADSFQGTGFEFTRQIKMKGGHWDINVYPSIS